MEINRKKFDAGRSNWVHGEHEGYTYEAKVFKAPSQFGIPTPRFQDGGNVSKLCVRDQFGQEVYAFDRGQDLATDDDLEAALQIVAALEAVFVGTMDEAAAQWRRGHRVRFQARQRGARGLRGRPLGLLPLHRLPRHLRGARLPPQHRGPGIEGAAMKNEQLYREAIKFAADAEERFLSAVEANKSLKDDRTLCETHQQMEVIPAAQCACAQQELIAHLFGVSDERIHEDLARVILSR